MNKAAAILIALVCSAQAQTFITVTADTNRVIRTNFSLVRSQVSDLSGATFAISNITGLQSALDGKLATNGSAAGLTDFPSSLLVTNGDAVALTNFPALLMRTNGDASTLTNFPSDLLRTNGDGGGLTNLPNANLTNATGVLGLGNGGTGATNAALAISNLLPSYTGNSNRFLSLNTNATALEWTNVSSGLSTVDLASTNVTGTLPIVRGGTGGTNTSTAQIALGIRATGTGGAAILGAFANVGSNTNAGGAAIGNNARTVGSGAALGADAKVLASPGIGAFGADGGAVGFFAEVNGRGGAVGAFAYAINGFAGGSSAKANATNSVQLLEGTNSSNDTIQFMSAGSVDTNRWSALANASTIGTNVMRATNASVAQGAIFPSVAASAPTNTNAPAPDAWLDVRVGTNNYKLALWQ